MKLKAIIDCDPGHDDVMAILLAADVPFAKWIRFAAVGGLLLVPVGLVAVLLA